MTTPASTVLSDLLRGLVDDTSLVSLGQHPIHAVTDDSRRVQFGSLFVAVPGATLDGRQFIDDALQRGAVAVISQDQTADDPRVLCVPDVRAALAQIAQRWYGITPGVGPSIVAITGTNGKSTTAYMLRSILRVAGQRVGLLGTIEYDLCGKVLDATLTTPGSLELCKHLRACADNDADTVVMEVSSHALSQRRTHGLQFAAAGFTNLSQDHLDYHKTTEAYAAAKAILFEELSGSATAVINVSDPAHERMLQDCQAEVLACGRSGKAQIFASIDQTDVCGTTFTLSGPALACKLSIRSALIGEHNVENAMIAAGLAKAMNVAEAHIKQGLMSMAGVPGRLERVADIVGSQVFVDYAHTPDALEHVLAVLRPLTRGRLICVFGCGGDRDRSKRPLMAQAVGRYADEIVLTNDNPRGEDPEVIVADTLEGFGTKQRANVCVQLDRQQAIYEALCGVGLDDVVLIAGKGHEDYQIVGEQRVHFSDIEVARMAAAESGLLSQAKERSTP